MEEGRDSNWSRCQKAPTLRPPPNSGGQKGAEEILAIQQEGHETGQGCTGARAQEGKEEPERFGVGGKDFPGGEVDRNLPANTGDIGSIPSPGRFHMPWSNWAHEPQLPSLHAETTEACVLRICALLQEKPLQ